MVANVKYERVTEKKMLITEGSSHPFEVEQVFELAMLLHRHFWLRSQTQSIELTAPAAKQKTTGQVSDSAHSFCSSSSERANDRAAGD